MTRRKGRVKYIIKWVTSFMDGTLTPSFQQKISYRGIYQSVTSRNLFSVIHFLLQQNFCCVTHHTKIVFYCITAHTTTKRKLKLCLNFFLFFYSKYLSLKKSLTCSFRRNREIFIMTLQKNSQQLNSLVNMFRI